MMPDVSGWAFRRPAAHSSRSSPPSPWSSSPDRASAPLRSPELGVDGYLPKPVDLDTLLSTVARFVPRPEQPEVASW